MDGKIRIRFANELWWDEIAYEDVLKWYHLEVSYLSSETCFVNIVNSANEKLHVELHRSDYDKIMSQKAFKLKFKLKKHNIL